MKQEVASRIQSNFKYMEPYYNLSFVCMAPKKQLKYFYISSFLPINKKGHFDCVTLDTSFNINIINPIYQLFIMLQQNSVNILDMLFDMWGDKDEEKYYKQEKLFYSIFADDFFYEFERDIDINTSIESFLEGKMWQELRRKCLLFLKDIELPIWKVFECPIRFSYFLYPSDFESYQRLPYWSEYKLYDFQEWNQLKEKYNCLYKDAEMNLNIIKNTCQK